MKIDAEISKNFLPTEKQFKKWDMGDNDFNNNNNFDLGDDNENP